MRDQSPHAGLVAGPWLDHEAQFSGETTCRHPASKTQLHYVVVYNRVIVERCVPRFLYQH